MLLAPRRPPQAARAGAVTSSGETAQDVLMLAESRLGALPGVTLLDRRDVQHVLLEQKLSLLRGADSTAALRWARFCVRTCLPYWKRRRQRRRRWAWWPSMHNRASGCKTSRSARKTWSRQRNASPTPCKRHAQLAVAALARSRRCACCRHRTPIYPGPWTVAARPWGRCSSDCCCTPTAWPCWNASGWSTSSRSTHAAGGCPGRRPGWPP